MLTMTTPHAELIWRKRIHLQHVPAVSVFSLPDTPSCHNWHHTLMVHVSVQLHTLHVHADRRGHAGC